MKVAVIGAGPRGLLIVSHLVHHFPESSTKRLEVNLFDPFPIAGRAWKTTQPKLLVMNTVAQEMTMFDDQSFNGPNLYQWAHGQAIPFIEAQNYLHKDEFMSMVKDLGPNDFTPRYLFGVYLQWFYKQIVDTLPNHVKVHFIQHAIKKITRLNGHYVLWTKNTINYDANRVIMSLGQQANLPDRKQRSLKVYAFNHDLLYYSEGYAEEKDLSGIKPRHKVIIRGMGLNFVDYVRLLTAGRGGRFHDHNGRLTYVASGREPRIIAGSIRGIPYYSKANNQKIDGYHEPTYFLDKAHVKRHLHGHQLPYRDFIHLLRLDMELVYYTHLIRTSYRDLDADHFKHEFMHSNNPDLIIAKYHFRSGDLINWKQLLDPAVGLKAVNSKGYRSNVIRWMNKVINDASLGNNTSSLAAALEVVRDDRNPIRKLLAQKRFSNDDYIRKFLPNLPSFSKFLSMGAPVKFMNELRALIRARIVTVLGPHMRVDTAKGHFITASSFYPKKVFKADVLIEARLPRPRLSVSANPLVKNLSCQGLLSQPTFTLSNGKHYHLDTTNVKVGTDQVIDRKGQIHPNLYIWGLPTEGIYFNTANSPHPSGHDALLHASDRISKQVLGLKFKPYKLM